jgi:hypothetical protein
VTVQVEFQDQMLRDEERQNVVNFGARSARTLAALLRRALQTAVQQPAKLR